MYTLRYKVCSRSLWPPGGRDLPLVVHHVNQEVDNLGQQGGEGGRGGMTSGHIIQGMGGHDDDPRARNKGIRIARHLVV